MLEQSLSDTCIFSVKHIIAILHLETLDRTSSPCLGYLWTTKSSTKNTKMQKKKKITSIKWTEKDPCSTSARRHVYRAIALHVSEWLQNCHQYLFGVTNMF